MLVRICELCGMNRIAISVRSKLGDEHAFAPYCYTNLERGLTNAAKAFVKKSVW